MHLGKHPCPPDAQLLQRITSIIARCPEVLSFQVRTFSDGIIAVEFEPRSEANSVMLDSDRAAEWNVVFDEFFDSLPHGSIEAVSRHGWISNYTSKPITEPEFEEWACNWETTISDLHPKVVLEIGCGAGTVLRRIAPQCTTYVATDASPAAIARLRPIISSHHQNATAYCASANDLSKIPALAYDTIILNSVIQYFPSEDYLRKVLDNSVALIGQAGGNIFIGDIRNLALTREFHLSVILTNESIKARLPEVERRLATSVANDSELQLTIGWFHQYCNNHPNVSGLVVRPKRCTLKTELSAYRFDVVLQVGQSQAFFQPQDQLDLTELSTAGDILDRLAASSAFPIVVASVSDALLVPDIFAFDTLNRLDSGKLTSLEHLSTPKGVPCGELFSLAAQRKMVIDVRLHPRSPTGTYQVIAFKDPTLNINHISDLIAPPDHLPHKTLCSDPMFSIAASRVIAMLRKQISSYCPDAVPLLLPVANIGSSNFISDPQNRLVTEL